MNSRRKCLTITLLCTSFINSFCRHSLENPANFRTHGSHLWGGHGRTAGRDVRLRQVTENLLAHCIQPPRLVKYIIVSWPCFLGCRCRWGQGVPSCEVDRSNWTFCCTGVSWSWMNVGKNTLRFHAEPLLLASTPLSFEECFPQSRGLQNNDHICAL